MKKIEKFEHELKDEKNRIQKEKEEVIKKCIELFCPKSRYGNEIDEEKFKELIESTINTYLFFSTDHVFTIPELEQKWNKKSERVEPTEKGIKGRKVKKCEDNFLNNLSKEDFDLFKDTLVSNTVVKSFLFHIQSLHYFYIQKEKKNRSFLKKIKYLFSNKKKKDDNFMKKYEEDVEKIKEISEKNIKNK